MRHNQTMKKKKNTDTKIDSGAGNGRMQRLVSFFYSPVVWWEKNFGDPSMTRFGERRGYRTASGGRWGLWDLGSGLTHVKMWIKSECEHYPAPPSANHERPLEIEDYS